MTVCKRCGSQSSVFWWRHALGVDSEGNNGSPFEICDDCMSDFLKFMQGYTVNDMIIVSRRNKND